MMSIVRRSPFFDVPTHVEVRGQPVLVRPFQLVVWVSIQGRGRLSPPLYEASVAVHLNVAGQRDVFRGGDPCQLSLREGIIVYPRGNPLGPRLPLLGLRALTENKLETVIDGERRELTIQRKMRQVVYSGGSDW